MRAFTSTELERMQGAQEDAMMDKGVILEYTETDRSDEYGVPVAPYVEGAVTVCGFDGSPRQEVNAPAGGGNVTQVDINEVRLRFPLDTRIDNLDRLRVTHRFGVLQDEPATYELLEQPRQGPSGLLVRARKVSDGG